MHNWKIILFIILGVIILKYILNKNIEGMTTNKKGDLYLIPEAPGFDIPELNKTQKIMDSTIAQKNFNKIIVVANAGKYLTYDGNAKKIKTPNRTVMTKQWNHPIIQSLNLPIEKWVFVCCSTNDIPASVLLNNLKNDFSEIKGFLLDSEDDTSSQNEFITEFKKMNTKYKYAIIGGPRKSIPLQKNPPHDLSWNKYFSEMYTEGGVGYYEENSGCVNLNDDSNAQNFWEKIIKALGNNSSVVPTVCGAGNCQEDLKNSPCFDERLSPNNITKLVENNIRGGDLAIWYGTGQQYNCQPSKSCLLNNDETTCNAASNCTWSQYKKNPNTKKEGLCYSDVTIANWGCVKKW